MLMFVGMRLDQLQCDAAQHQSAACCHAPTQRAIAKGDGQQGTDEWRESEHRARASGPEGALRKQVQTQAQAIAARTDEE